MSALDSPPGSTDTAQLATPGVYQLDPVDSRVEFTTRHLFGLGEVRGSLAVIGGRITIAAEPTASTVTAHIAASSFDSGSAGRDKVVKSPGYLHVDAYPRIIFVSHALVEAGRGWVARGSITARGTAAPVDLTITEIIEGDGDVTVRATATVDRYAHGLTKGKGLAARTLHIALTARADRL